MAGISGANGSQLNTTPSSGLGINQLLRPQLQPQQPQQQPVPQFRPGNGGGGGGGGRSGGGGLASVRQI